MTTSRVKMPEYDSKAIKSLKEEEVSNLVRPEVEVVQEQEFVSSFPTDRKRKISQNISRTSQDRRGREL